MTKALTPKNSGNRRMTTGQLVHQAFEQALDDSGLFIDDIDGVLAVPSLAEPRVMYAHAYATMLGILPRKHVIARTIDTGGAGPVSALIQARQMILNGECNVIAIVAADTVASLPVKDFLQRAGYAIVEGRESMTEK